MRLSHAPIRITSGSYILNAGVAKLLGSEGADELYKVATTAYPAVAGVDPARLWQIVGLVESGLGSALIVPFVRPRVAGAALLAYAAWSLGMYVRIERFRVGPSDPRPSLEGLVLAKDLWLAGIALNLLFDPVASKRRRHGAGQ